MGKSTEDREIKGVWKGEGEDKRRKRNRRWYFIKQMCKGARESSFPLLLAIKKGRNTKSHSNYSSVLPDSLGTLLIVLSHLQTSS